MNKYTALMLVVSLFFINMTYATRSSKSCLRHLNIFRKSKEELSQAKAQRIARQKLIASCKSTEWTPERKLAAKNFTKFQLGIGFTSSTIFYTYNNWDKPKDATLFYRYAYEVAVGLIFAKVVSKIISNPKDHPLVKGFKKYIATRFMGPFETAGYAYLFATPDNKIKKRLNQLMADPKYADKIKKLIKNLEDKNFYQKSKERFIELASSLMGSTSSVKQPIDQSKTINSIDWANLSKEDLKDKTIQDILFLAVAREMYEEQSGWIQLGDVGMDRYAFHSAYGILSMPLTLPLNLKIYDILCLGQQNPKKALMKAVALYVISRPIIDQLYYGSRAWAVNQ
ncbi:MAG: hypothetical protein ISR65_13095 [Bacteriovoracaceae bacterium]|nr:hypothetical protein [Bacteriovoracaceae bacterium]